MRKWVLILFVMLLCAAGCRGESSAAAAQNKEGAFMKDISAREAASLIEASEALLILDIRTPGEYTAGHIPGAVLVDWYDPDFATMLEKFEKDIPVLVYCRTGSRSRQSLPVFEEAGFTQAYHLQHGIVDWMNQDLPLAVPE